MKIAFATCVQLGLSCIEKIISIGGKLDLLITLKDEKAKNKSGRVYLDDISSENDISLLKIDNINDDEVISALKEMNIDWLFIIGWSQIARPVLLGTPVLGCIGMHPTLLPIGRGRAAIPWAIIKGLSKTGVTLFKLDEGVDTGDIIGQQSIEIGETTNAGELYRKIDELHVSLLEKYWNDIYSGNVTLTEQDEKLATEWPGRKPEDGEIFNTMTMCEAERLVRAVTKPYPGAFYIENSKKLIIWSAKTNNNTGSIKLSDGFLVPIDFETV